jgi:hypothetical protein
VVTRPLFRPSILYDHRNIPTTQEDAMSTIVEIRESVREHLAALEAEMIRWRDVLSSLGEYQVSSNSPVRAIESPPAPRRRAGRPRGAPGTVVSRVRAYVLEHPGAAGVEVAEKLKLSPTHAYNTLRHLAERGELRVEGARGRRRFYPDDGQA